LAEDLISKYIFKAEGINEVKAQAAQLGGYLQNQGSSAGNAFSSSFKGTLGKINVGQIAGTMAAGAVAAAPIALATGLAHATSVAAGFEQSMANVASVTGGGADSIARLSEVAREAGASSVFSASEAGDAMYYLASAGMNEQQIAASLGDTLQLAAAGGMGLAESTEIVTSTLAQFGMEADEAGRASNVMAAAAAASNTTIAQLGAGMGYVGPVAASLGMSLEETTAAMGLLANAGIKGERGGTALRGALSALMQPSKTAAGALEEMGLSIEDVDPAANSLTDIIGKLEGGSMTAAQAVAIFGREAGPSMLALVSQGSAALEKMEDSITGTNKASQMAATQTDTFQGAMKMLGSAVEEAEITVGNALLPSLTGAVQGFTEGVKWATEWGSTVSSAFEGITGNAPDWKMFFPGVELYEGLEKLDNKVGEVLSGGTETRGLVGSFVGDVTGALSDGLKSAGGQIKIGDEWMKDMADVQAARDAGKLTAQEYLQGLKEVSASGVRMKGPTTGLMDSLQEFATTGKLTTDQYKESLSSVSEIYSQVGDAAAEMTGPLTEGFEEGTVSAEDYIAILEDMSTVSEKLGDGADEALEPLTQAFEDGTVSAEEYKDIMDDVANAVTSLGSDFDSIAGPIQEAFSQGEISATQYQDAINSISDVHAQLGESTEYVTGPITEMFESGEISADEYITALDGVLSGSKEFGTEFTRQMADLNANAGNMSADEYLAAFNDIITDLGVNIEKELKDVDAEGAGEDAGKDFISGLDRGARAAILSGDFSAISGEDNLLSAASYYNSFRQVGEGAPKQATSEFEVEGVTTTVKYKPASNFPVRVVVGGVALGHGFRTYEAALEAMDKEHGMLLGLADPNAFRIAYLEAVAEGSRSAQLRTTAKEELIELGIRPALLATIQDPYVTWGSPQHMASKYAEYAREGIEEPLFNSIYNITRNLEEEGKAGMMQAWQTILDPSATQAEVDAAFDLLLESDVFGGWGRDVGMAYRDGLIDSFDGVYIDFADEMEKIAQEGADVFSDNFVGEDEAQTMIDRLTWAMTQDPAAFEEAGGKTALQYWEGLQAELDKLEAMIAAEADPSQIADQRELIAQIIGDHPYQIQVEAEVNAFGGPLAQGPLDEDGNPITLASLLFGTDADRRREIKRDDLWFKNTVMPVTEDHIDKMLAAATTGYDDDYQAALENAEKLYALQDIYGQKYLNLRQNQLITALRQGEIGIMAFNEQWDKLNAKQEESKKKVDELSDKYGNLAKTTAEAGDDCCEAMSAFGKAQEASSDMFFESYIGPTENYVPWLAETGEYDKRISVGFDFPDDIDQQVAEYLASHPAEMDVNLKELDKEISDKWLAGLGLSTDLEINPPSEEDIFGFVNTIEEADATITPGADLNQDDLYNIVTEINTTETAMPVGLNATQLWNEYMSIVTKISSWRVYIPVDVDVVANIPALASQIKAEILAGLQS
jgi:TP901 family phage tail tape measure protein